MSKVVISNSRVNSYGSRVLTEGIDLTQYKRNPILLWMHNRPWRGTKDEVLPLGRVEDIIVDGDNLLGTVVFDETDEFSRSIKAKWDAGTLKMVSPGLDVVEMSDSAEYILPGQRRATVTKSKLVEVSIVDLGANDDALALYKDGKIINLSEGNEHFIPELVCNLNIDNNMKTIALKLGLPEVATEQEILQKISELQGTAGRVGELELAVQEQKNNAIVLAVEAAIQAKKITADKKEHFVTLGKTAGIELLNKTLDSIHPASKPTDFIGSGGDSKKVEYKKLSDVPTDKLEAMRSEDKEQYMALFKAEYGYEPKLYV